MKQKTPITLVKILILVLNTTYCLAQAPAIEWQKTLGGLGGDEAYSIQQTTDGGYIVAGWSNSTDGDVSGNHGNYDYWIVKLNASGDITWSRSLGGSSEDIAMSIQQTTDGGYIVAGRSGSKDGDVTSNHLGLDYWIVKLNDTGGITWQKALGGSNTEEAWSIQQTTDGGYIVAGRTGSRDGDIGGVGSGFYYADYWIVKLNDTGDITWQKRMGGTNLDYAHSIQQTTDGGYIVAGFTQSNDGDVMNFHGGADYWIVKLNDTGGITWTKTLGGLNGEDAWSVIQTTDGEYVIAGYAESTDGDISGNRGSLDYWIVKLNSSGDTIWTKTLGGSGFDDARAIQQTTDGGYIIAGYTTSTDGDISDKHGGNSDGWIVKLNSSGDIIWTKLIGGLNSEIVHSIQQTSDGGYIIAGYLHYNYDDENGYNGKRDYWIVKLAPDNVPLPITLRDIAARNIGSANIIDWTTAMETIGGEFELQRSSNGRHFQTTANIKGKGIAGSYQYTDTRPLPGMNYYRLFVHNPEGYSQYSRIVTAILAEKNAFAFNLSPNPAKGILHVYINGKLSQNALIEILTFDGKVIKSISVTGNETNIDVSDIPKGIYTVHYTDGVHIDMNKLVIQ